MAKVTLSFDNGPDPETTGAVLDALARQSLRATFFLIARKLDDPGARRLAERARAEGHWIGNHTLNHEVALGCMDDETTITTEIDGAQSVIGSLAEPERLFRPFGEGGVINSRLLSARAYARLVAGRYTLVLWNSVPRDWEDPDGWAARARADCAGRAWSLLVLHDTEAAMASQLDRFLGTLRDDGHDIVQEFPPDCVPLRLGRLLFTIEGIIPP